MRQTARLHRQRPDEEVGCPPDVHQLPNLLEHALPPKIFSVDFRAAQPWKKKETVEIDSARSSLKIAPRSRRRDAKSAKGS